jgi:TonB family protein
MWQFAMISPANENCHGGFGGGNESDSRIGRLLSLGCFAVIVSLHIAFFSAIDFFAKPEAPSAESRGFSLSFDFADSSPGESINEAVSEAAPEVPAPAALMPREELPAEAEQEAASDSGPPTEAERAVPAAAPLPIPAEGLSTGTGNAAESAASFGPVSPVSPRPLMTDAEYLALIMGLLEKNKINPLSVRKRGIEGDVTVDFTIKRDGTVSAMSPADPSGHRFLVQAAFETIRSASPFPVKEGHEGDYTARVSIRYQLEDQTNKKK